MALSLWVRVSKEAKISWEILGWVRVSKEAKIAWEILGSCNPYFQRRLLVLKRKEHHASLEWCLFGSFLGVMARKKQLDFEKN